VIQVTPLILKIRRYGVTHLWVLYIYTEQQMKKIVHNEIILAYHLKNVVHAPVLQR